MTENDITLLKRFSTGADAEAFAQLVQRYVQMVYSASWRVLKNDNDATDVTQETFFELTRHAGRISGSLGCWLHRVATQKSIDVVRRSVHRRKREQAYARSRPVQVRTWQDMSGYVDQALDTLDDTSRAMLLDHFIGGKTTAQMAEEQGVSQATISRRVNASLDRLRAVLRRRGLLVTAAALATMLAQDTARAVSAEALGGLGKMAMIGTTRSAAATATKAGLVKALVAMATLIGTLAAASYVQHTRSSRRAAEPLAVNREAAPSAGTIPLPGLGLAGPAEPDEAGRIPTFSQEPNASARIWAGESSPEAMEAIATSVAAEPALTPALSHSARTLHFPEDRSIGIVYVQNGDVGTRELVRGFHPGHQSAEKEYLACARGEVRIPPGQRVTLSIQGIGVTPLRYLKTIETLDPNALYGLQFVTTEPITILDNLIAALARLQGLRQLDLSSISVNPRGLSALATLARLEQLSTPRGLADDGMAEIAGMTSLKILDVTQNNLTDAGLASIGRLTSLESLDLYTSDNMTDAGFEALANLRSLRYLRLGLKDSFTARSMDTLAAMPSLRVLCLDRPEITDDQLHRLSKSRSLERISLRRLGTITRQGLAFLAQMPQLKGLDISSAQLADTDLDVLSGMDGLEDLYLSRCFTDAGVGKLTALTGLKRLTVNAWDASPLTDASLAVVARMRSLEELTIGGIGFTNAGIAQLAAQKNLRSLHLTWAGLDDETLRLLAALPNLHNLSWMHCRDVTTSGLNALSQLVNLEQLTAFRVRRDGRLDLSGLTGLQRLSINLEPDTSDAGLDPNDLAWLPALAELKSFGLSGVGIDDAGLAHLATSPNLNHLTVTGGPELTDEGLHHLSDLGRIESLTIWNSQITEDGFRHLYPLKTLSALCVYSTVPISSQGLAQLRNELPHLQSLAIGPIAPDNQPIVKATTIRSQQNRAPVVPPPTPTRPRRRR